MSEPHQLFSRGRFHAWLPVIAAPWALVLWLVSLNPRLGLWLALALAVIVPALAGWLIKQSPRWLLPLSISLFLISALGAFSVVGPKVWQFVIAIVSTVMLAMQLGRDRWEPGSHLGLRLTNLTVALTIFFGWFVLLNFASGIFVAFPWWYLAGGGAALTGLTALQVWGGGVTWRQAWLVWLLVTVVGAGLMIATWWLPVVSYIGSIIAATVLTLWLQTIRHLWLNTWEAGRGRRYLIVGGIVILLVLVTAKWN